MKIIAVSDLHGNTIPIKDKADVLVIAGDFSPLYCQQDPIAIIGWFDRVLIPWLKRLQIDNFVIIPGNHDFACTFSFFKDDLDTILHRHGMKDRVHYLNRSSVTIQCKKFYGIPDTESLTGWAFSKAFNVDYSFDEDTDVLVTHQPPHVGNVGFVSQLNREFGSDNLRSAILNSNIDVNICGHIHTGDHSKNMIQLNNGKLACIYNVSILDEDYEVAYDYATITI
jgi:Icc-related predicted phosphoesterase